MFALFCQGADGGIGKFFPSFALVRACLMGTHGKGGVQQQYALVGPTGEVTACGDGGTQVGLYLLEDVLQGRREGDTVVHREAKSVCLSGTMIGILPDNDYLCSVERTKVESIEYQLARRVDGGCPVFGAHKVGETDEVVFLKLWCEMLLPAFFYLYIHNGFVLNQLHTPFGTFTTHFFGPDASLDFANVCFLQIEHAEA